MEVQVKLFATLRQEAGWADRKVDLPEQATVADLVDHLVARQSTLSWRDRAIYAAVNQEYVQSDRALQPGDVVALFPPVSGGEEDAGQAAVKRFEVTTAPLSLDDVARRVTRPDCGAITTFAGTVRGETTTETGDRSTDYLVYEAYAEMAEAKLAQIADEIREQWPKVRDVSILHRIGHVDIGEPSVVIAVATPHRGDGCFEACRYAIERLKAIVPIWKQENWSDGQVWVEGPRQPELDVTPTDIEAEL